MAETTGTQGQNIYVMVWGAKYPDTPTCVAINRLHYSLAELGHGELEPEYVSAVIFGQVYEDYLHLAPGLDPNREAERISAELSRDESLTNKQPRRLSHAEWRAQKDAELETAEWTKYGERIR